MAFLQILNEICTKIFNLLFNSKSHFFAQFYLFWTLFDKCWFIKSFGLTLDLYCRLDGAKRDSLASDVKNPIESDTDSMAEYGDGETGKLKLHTWVSIYLEWNN